MKHNFMTKMASALLAVVLSTAAFSVTAFASGGEETTESVAEQETAGDVSDLLSALAGSQVTVSVTEDGIQFSSGENDSGQIGTVIQTTAQHPQQIFQCFRIQRERTFSGTSLAVTYRHVAGIDIADLFRQDDLQPVAVRADHLHGRSVRKLGEGGIIHSGASADI